MVGQITKIQISLFTPEGIRVIIVFPGSMNGKTISTFHQVSLESPDRLLHNS
jgi:hypothetical protein